MNPRQKSLNAKTLISTESFTVCSVIAFVATTVCTALEHARNRHVEKRGATAGLRGVKLLYSSFV